MDLILKNAVLAGGDGRTLDVGIADGRIKAIEAGLAAEGETLDLNGRLLSPGFIETHIHLDKACIMERCRSEKGDLAEAIDEVTKSKKEFSEADVAARASWVLEKCVSHGTTHMRTHLEVDPGIGMRGFDGVFPLIEAWRWAIDVEICVFPQEGSSTIRAPTS